MALRRIYRCLERPDAVLCSAQDTWCEPQGHLVEFCYQPFGGHWGTWHHMHVAIDGPKEWVFRPFVDQQEQLGSKGRMQYTQHHMPQNAAVGSVWLCPLKSFKRVLSRGGAWENVNLGSKHPDEKDREDEQQQESGPETEPGDNDAEVSLGTGELSSGNGDDGQVPPVQSIGEENTGVVNQEGLPTYRYEEGLPTYRYEEEAPVAPTEAQEGEGVDANGSPVV